MPVLDPFDTDLLTALEASRKTPTLDSILTPEGANPELDFWDNVNWWDGTEDVPIVRPKIKQKRQAVETFQEQTPGSPAAFQAAEAATMPGKVTTGDFVMEMLAREGAEYQWGGTSRKTGFDCSGIVWRIFHNKGFNIPRTSGELIAHSEQISVKKALNTRGALLWHEGHIAVSLGDGKRTIEAGSEATGVHIGEAAGRFTKGGILPETQVGKPLHAEHRNRVRQRREVTQAARPKDIGATDLDAPIMPVHHNITEALLAMFTEPVAARGRTRPSRKVTLSDFDTSSPEGIKTAARKVARAYGWTGKDWKAIDAIIAGGTVDGLTVGGPNGPPPESGWNPEAANPNSTARGIGQAMMSVHFGENWERSKAAKKYLRDPMVQIRWLMRYIKGRYGNPMEALRYKVAHGTY